MKRKHFEQYGDHKARLFPELHPYNEDGKTKTISKTVTFQVTDACNLACTYCYQINKGKRRMSFETAKQFIDMLLNSTEKDEYINPISSPFLILDFI